MVQRFSIFPPSQGCSKATGEVVNARRVLVISHAAVVPAYRRKFAEAARQSPDIHFVVVTPHEWIEGGRRVRGGGEHDGNYWVQPFPAILAGKQYGHIYRSLGRLMLEVKPSLIHLEEEPPSLVAWQVCYLRQKLVSRSSLIFFTWENLAPAWSGWRALLYPRIESRVWQASNAAIAGTQMAKDLLEMRGYQKRVFVLPQVGIDINHFSPRDGYSVKERLGLTPPVIGFAGRLIPEKGVQDLVKAVGALQAGSLLVVGSGSGRFVKELNDLARSVRAKLFHVEAVPHEMMPEFLSAMDVLVLPSRTSRTWAEQFGRVMLEAMSCGVPVIASQTGAITEVGGEAILSYPEGDVQALADCLERVLHDENLRASLSAAGRERVMRLFCNEVVTTRLLNIYSEFLP